MTPIVKLVGAFVMGIITGAGVTYVIMKRKNEEEINTEMEAAREHYDTLKGDLEELASKYKPEYEAGVKALKNPQIESENGVVEPSGDRDGKENRERHEMIDKLGGNRKRYTISPEQFSGEKVYYDKVTLTYYLGDRTLANVDDEIQDVARTIGWEALNHFGEYEEDVVYVRNDKDGVDYEVIRDSQSFESYIGARAGDDEDEEY